jgi:hypothetical protein
MELMEKCMTSLFEQLGEASDAVGIARFIELHGGLCGGTQLHEAVFWSASQASFLREARVQDAAWSHVVDELNVTLHAMPGAVGSGAVQPAV